MTKKEDKIKETKNTKKTTTKKRKRVRVDRDTEVVFMNNTNGSFYYECPKTHNIYELSGYGDIDYITMEELIQMKNAHKKMLSEFWIVLIDVEGDEYEIEDVIKQLQLSDIYGDTVRPDDIDGFITKSSDERFQSAMKTMNKALAKRVIERSVKLHKKGEVNHISKINFIKEFSGKDDLFE